MKLVNLLPKDKQKDLFYETVFHSFVVFVEIGLVTLLLVFAGLFATRFYISRAIERYDQDIIILKQVTDKQENAELKKQIQSINAMVSDYNQLVSVAPSWSKVLRVFAEHVPNGVKLQSFNADTAKLKVDISGIAPSREQVILLHDNIAADNKNFENIDYPLENIVKPTNVPFHFTFYIKPELLTQNQ
jgi:Tfp pilus assembly protein PilN